MNSANQDSEINLEASVEDSSNWSTSEESLTNSEIWSLLNINSTFALTFKGLVDWLGIYYIVTQNAKVDWNLLFNYILRATNEQGRINPLLTMEEVSLEVRYLAYIAIWMGVNIDLVSKEFIGRANSYLLCWMCRVGNQVAVSQLLQSKDANPSFWNGMSMIEACSHNTIRHSSVLKLLLNDSRVDINLKLHKLSPIKAAVKSKSLEAVRLLSEDYRIDREELLKACYIAAKKHRIDIIDLLLNHHYVNTRLNASIILKAIVNPKSKIEALKIYETIVLLLTDEVIVPPIKVDELGQQIRKKVMLLKKDSKAGIFLKDKLTNLLFPLISELLPSKTKAEIVKKPRKRQSRSVKTVGVNSISNTTN